MADTEFDAKLKEFASVLEKFGSRTKSLADTIADYSKRVAAGRDPLERQQRAQNALKNVTDSTTNEMKELLVAFRSGKVTQSEYREAINSSKNAISAMSGVTHLQREMALKAVEAGERRARAELDAEQSIQKLNKTTDFAFRNVGAILGGIANKNPIAGANAILKKEAEAVSGALGFVGTGLMTFGTKLPGRAGKAAGGLGAGLSVTGAALNKFKDLFDPLAQVLIDFQANFKNAANIGIVFGGGMSELRNVAGQAGIKMEDLIGGVSASEDAFRKGGLSTTQATRMIGQFGRGLVEGREASQLFALGFTDVKDRVALAGGAFDQARSRGMSLAETQANLTKLTVQYGADLKVLQGIAGKDAEKALERARAETQRGALIAKLNDEQKNAFQGAYTSLEVLGPQADKARLALMQLAQGGEITDPEILVNEPVRKMLESMNSSIQRGSGTIREGGDVAAKILSEAAESMRGPAGQFGRDLDAARIQMGRAPDGLIAGAADIANALLAVRMNVQQGADAQKEVNKALEGTDQLTKTVESINQSMYKASVALEQVATSNQVIGRFATVLETAIEPLNKMVEKLREFGGIPAPKKDEKDKDKDEAKLKAEVEAAEKKGAVVGEVVGGAVGMAVGAKTGAAIGTAIGAFFGGVGAAPGAAIGGVVGGIAGYFGGTSVGGTAGSAIGGALATPKDKEKSNVAPGTTIGSSNRPMSTMDGIPMPEFAKGGIINAPRTGMPARLHGREMVLPLPDNLSKAEIEKLRLQVERDTEMSAMSRIDPNPRGSIDNTKLEEIFQTEKPSDKALLETNREMVSMLATLNQRFDEMNMHMREVVSNTDRTARGLV